MSTHNIYLRGEIRKIFTRYPPLSRPMISPGESMSHNIRECTFRIVALLRFRLACTESSLGTFLDSQGCKIFFMWATRTDQTAWMCRLISVFARHVLKDQFPTLRVKCLSERLFIPRYGIHIARDEKVFR